MGPEEFSICFAPICLSDLGALNFGDMLVVVLSPLQLRPGWGFRADVGFLDLRLFNPTDKTGIHFFYLDVNLCMPVLGTAFRFCPDFLFEISSDGPCDGGPRSFLTQSRPVLTHAKNTFSGGRFSFAENKAGACFLNRDLYSHLARCHYRMNTT